MNEKHYNKIKGNAYEDVAKEYVIRKGCVILETNFRSKLGEIDLIYHDGETLVFAEVKYRRSSLYGSPLEAVDFRKQRKICKVSDYYRLIHGIDEFSPIRFDVISICGGEIEWFQNAFYYC